ncbi:MAG: cobalamin biosynthesis protein CobD [Thermodesulfovibrio sp.]|nr:cobalamin biosynthesis protein CobD [Thermodesulfovibrio sp.]
MIDFIQPSVFSLHPLILMLAFLLDLAIGDPRCLPHPVRITGSAIIRLESFIRRFLKTSAQEKSGGIFLVILIVIPVFLITLSIQEMIFWSMSKNFYIMLLGIMAAVFLTSTILAVRELIRSARAVIEAVKDKTLDSARRNLSMIVGRDTHCLSEKDVLKATMETLAENLSDGIIAPLFYLTIGGLPLAMTYKAINTLDSMVGYKNERYKHFGWAAARLDDIANYIPARISGALIVITSFIVKFSLSGFYYSLKIMLRDGRNHSSPNSGVPEAAIAGALGVRLGGPSTYGGIIVSKPYIGEDRQNTNNSYLKASENALTIIKIASSLGLIIAITLLHIRTAL